MGSQIRAVVGLGNPGSEYEDTYHNAGKIAVDWLAECAGNGAERAWKKRAGLFLYKKAGALTLIKPLAFMNDSGAAVARALHFFKLKPAELAVIHDDSDIALGKCKFSFDRGPAGHKGAESVIKSLGTKKFWRLRIGVRRQSRTSADYGQTNMDNTQTDLEKSRRKSASSLLKSAARAKAGDFVLKKISGADKKTLLASFEKISAPLYECAAADRNPARRIIAAD